jgi:hypothetical protein
MILFGKPVPTFPDHALSSMLDCPMMNEFTSATSAAEQTSVLQSALRGLACKCPRCGKGRLYAGFLN